MRELNMAIIGINDTSGMQLAMIGVTEWVRK
jgi:hypothetical protein